MSGFTVNLPSFAIVVIVMVAVGFTALIAPLVDGQDGVVGERRGLWLFHGGQRSMSYAPRG